MRLSLCRSVLSFFGLKSGWRWPWWGEFCALVAHEGMGDQPSLRRDFADAFDDAAIALCASVEAACAQGRSWPARVTAAVYAVLEFFVSEPEGARVLTVDAVAFGPYGAMRRARLIEHFAALLATGRDYCATGIELPCLTEQALVGGIAWVISGEVSDGRADRLGQLLPGSLS